MSHVEVLRVNKAGTQTGKAAASSIAMENMMKNNLSYRYRYRNESIKIIIKHI